MATLVARRAATDEPDEREFAPAADHWSDGGGEMMRRSIRILFGLGVLLLLPGLVSAQGRPASDAGNGGERYLDYFVSQWWTADRAERQSAAVGGRLMWALPTATENSHLPIGRAYVGGYLMRLRHEGESWEAWHYGTQADLSVARAPLFGRVDPIVSLAVGALRTTAPFDPLFDLERVNSVAPSQTVLTLAPGIGARIRLMPRLEIRSDIRRLQEMGDDSRGYFEMAGGLSLGA
jgi:hypothetical protein